jgi:predicted SAM-dependent methyltransferase
MRPATLTVKRAVRTLYYSLPLSTWAAHSALRRIGPPYKLNFGCGMAPLPGWINVDLSLSAKADVFWNLKKRFPLPEGSCSHIYNESLFELFKPEDGRAFLQECRRLLAPGGVMRLAIPSLEEVVALYQSGDWRHFDPLNPGYAHYQVIRNGAQMINSAFRHPDNQWLYDWEDLTRVVTAAGFHNVRRQVWGESECPELRGLETRPESLLICEVCK